jgi:hypothetical protein
MFCKNCGDKVEQGAQFCSDCGDRIVAVSSGGQSHSSKISHEPYQQEAMEVCQLCGSTAPVMSVNLNANIGMLFMRREKQMKGRLCKKCISDTFWNFTMTNLFLGWWGVISFFATCAFMIGNIFQYVSSLSMKKTY